MPDGLRSGPVPLLSLESAGFLPAPISFHGDQRALSVEVSVGGKRFPGARLPARKEAAAFSPTPPREAAAHGMGVFVCVCVGRAFRGKAAKSAEAAAGQGAR